MKLCLCLLLMLFSLISKATDGKPADKGVIPLVRPISHEVEWKTVTKDE